MTTFARGVSAVHAEDGGTDRSLSGSRARFFAESNYFLSAVTNYTSDRDDGPEGRELLFFDVLVFFLFLTYRFATKLPLQQTCPV